ncbi:hypothetical protein [Pseudomonas monteilii]|uniref:hypothetical protein n=1 Tax=Pseudomonas monteilii TaxID=76759 RepID=UPI00383A780E
MPPEYQLDATNKLAVLPMWVIDRIKEEMRLGPAAWQAITDAVEQAEVPQALPCEVKLPPGTVVGQGSPLSTLLMAIVQRASQPAHAQVFCSEPPAPQPHPEPIAWMVGTAFWWTKEEAERDAAAMGLQIVGLGPMTAIAPAEQHQGEPVVDNEQWWAITPDGDAALVIRVAACADPGEVERLRNCLRTEVDAGDSWKKEAQELRDQLAETNTAAEQLLQARDLAREQVRIREAQLADRNALLTKMKALFRVDDPFDLYNAVCIALSTSAAPQVES